MIPRYLTPDPSYPLIYKCNLTHIRYFFQRVHRQCYLRSDGRRYSRNKILFGFTYIGDIRRNDKTIITPNGFRVRVRL